MKRIGELDGLRALAVLMVVAWHYIGIPDGPNFWLWRIFYLGHFGVDLFFVLSGFLITTILLENRQSDTFFSSFYGRRAFRIWPAYYLMCAVCFAGWLSGASPGLFQGVVPGWTYIFGVQNFWMAKLQNYGVYCLSVTWSLAIEEQFYLVFPPIVRRVPVDILPKILIAAIVICPLGRLVDSFTGDQFGILCIAAVSCGCAEHWCVNRVVATLWCGRPGAFAQDQENSCLLVGSATADLARWVANRPCGSLATYRRGGVFWRPVVPCLGARRVVQLEMVARTGGSVLREDVLLCLPDPSLRGICSLRCARHRTHRQDIFRYRDDCCGICGNTRSLCVELPLV